MANPAIVDDIQARWQPLTEQQATNADAYLGDAWVLLKRRIPTLEADVATDADLSAAVVAVEVAMVLRVLKNPDGVQETSLSIDDASRTWKRSGDTSTGLLYVTDAELDMLYPGRSTAAFSIRQTAVPYCSAVWEFPLTVDPNAGPLYAAELLP